MSNCDNCGCRIYNGLCTNCHEEAYILDVQCADLDVDLEISKDFQRKAEDQRSDAKRKRLGRQTMNAADDARAALASEGEGWMGLPEKRIPLTRIQFAKLALKQHRRG